MQIAREKNLVDMALDRAKILPYYHQECGDDLFIAGGCCTRMFYEHDDLKGSDIDIYCTEPHKHFLAEELVLAGFSLTKTNSLVNTYADLETNTTYQLISFPENTVRLQKDCAKTNQILETFDLSACRMLYMYGKVIPLDDETQKTLDGKKLRVYTIRNSKGFERIIKYMSRYQLSLDLEDENTSRAHMLMRQYLLSTFPPEQRGYAD
jgi:hypothetical protein